ncbi:MAG: transmembrane 220 family protein [Chitinophagaceae bacterium]|nr:transmembrane 220 family protein [Chitinophagaceae bacterium]
MKIFNLIFCVLFILFAALQYNDPDPYLWIPIYLYVAALCCLAFRQKIYPKLYLFGIVIYAFYAAYLFFSKDGMLDWMREHQAENIAHEMKAKKPWIEATREFFGLVILIVVLLVNYFYSRRRIQSIHKP